MFCTIFNFQTRSRYLLRIGLTTFVFAAFTFRNSFRSSQSLMEFITRLAAFTFSEN